MPCWEFLTKVVCAGDGKGDGLRVAKKLKVEDFARLNTRGELEGSTEHDRQELGETCGAAFEV
jgi:hypothetical protein